MPYAFANTPSGLKPGSRLRLTLSGAGGAGTLTGFSSHHRFIALSLYRFTGYPINPSDFIG